MEAIKILYIQLTTTIFIGSLYMTNEKIENDLLNYIFMFLYHILGIKIDDNVTSNLNYFFD
jgi:hypothetical protein